MPPSKKRTSTAKSAKGRKAPKTSDLKPRSKGAGGRGKAQAHSQESIPQSRDHLYRILFIFNELQNGRHSTLSKLADHLGVVPRTIQRDIETMRSLLEIGISSRRVDRIVGDRLKKGGDTSYTLDPGMTHFPMVRIGKEDLLTIHFLQEHLLEFKNTTVGKSMLESFRKSFGLLTGTTDWRKWSRVVHFRFEGRPEVAKEDAGYFNTLHEAVLNNRKVSFVYRSMTPAPGVPKETSRVVHPNFIFFRSGSFYLHALDPGEDKEKIFKFARIRSLRMLEESFKPKPRYQDPAEYFRYSYAVIPSGTKPVENVVIEFTGKSSIRRVEETLWHPEQKLTKLSDEKVRLELPFSEVSYLELRPWILSWGANAKVVGPKRLKDEVVDDIRKMAESL